MLIHRTITLMIYYQEILSSAFPDTLMASESLQTAFQSSGFEVGNIFIRQVQMYGRGWSSHTAGVSCLQNLALLHCFKTMLRAKCDGAHF